MRLSVMLAAFALVSAACSSDGGSAGEAGSIKIGVISSTSGDYSMYGDMFVRGFEAGLDYATDGTGVVAGHPLEVTYHDDASDPNKAASTATNLIGEGYKILTGSISSSTMLKLGALAEANQILYVGGSGAVDEVTGLNRYTFRSGSQTYQLVQAAASLIGEIQGKKVVVFAQDYAYGQSSAKSVAAVMGEGAGAEVQSVLVPTSASDFVPFARRVIDADPDLVYVAWAGDNTSAMWRTLEQQGVLDVAEVVAELPDRNSYQTVFSTASDRISFAAHYFPDAASNEANDFLRAYTEPSEPNVYDPDGFVAAQMIVRAIEQADGDDVEAMISALEGWTFEGPKGTQTVRSEDHAMIQEMFTARLTMSNGEYNPTLNTTISGEDTAPPVTRKNDR